MSQGNHATFVSQSVPAQMTGGRLYPVSITMRNTGTTTWTRAGGYKLGAQNPQDTLRWGLGRVELGVDESVPPGATRRFDFQVRAPASGATYPFQWRMLREFVEWFGDFTPVVNVTVVASETLRVKYRYHVIGCGYPRYGSDRPADRVNVRWPEWGYWKDGVVNGTWIGRAQSTTEYGRRTLGLCRESSIRVLTGWWDINDQVALTNRLRAFQAIDLKNEPLRLAFMFGAQNFNNPAVVNGRPLDSRQAIKEKVEKEWAPAAANRDRYAWLTDDTGRERPIVMIWGDPVHSQGTQYRDYLLNTIRPLYRAATRAEPFIIMVNHALFRHNVDKRIYEALDAVYNHACAFGPDNRPITTGESVPLTEQIFRNDLQVLAGAWTPERTPLVNWEGRRLVYLPGSMPQFNEDRMPGRPNPRYVLAAAPTEEQGRADVTAMFRLIKRYAPTISVTPGSGDCDLVVNKWVTVSTMDEWEEGTTLEPSVVRGRKYQGSTADPRNSRCDYGRDFLEIIGQLFADRIVTITRRELEEREPVRIP